MSSKRDVAQEIQARMIIPHCAVCARPCCRLEELVLDLDWRRARALYGIEASRREFDESLRDGTGPAHIKEQRGRYYAHGRPCPAYDEKAKRCGVYGTALKPRGCGDFPIYSDGDAVTADTRCEAVDLDAIECALGDVERVPDARWPVLVSFVRKKRPDRR